MIGDDLDQTKPKQEFMEGTWLGSFSSLLHDEPPDRQTPPTAQLGGFFDVSTPQTSRFDQTNGYVPAATILCLKFKKDFTLSGKIKINRGGVRLTPDDSVTGNYTRSYDDNLAIYDGTFTTVFKGDSPDQDILNHYYFIAKSLDEIEWIWTSSSKGGSQFRASVARGTLTRVRKVRRGKSLLNDAWQLIVGWIPSQDLGN